STSSSQAGLRCWMSARARVSLDRTWWMNLCPPKPGFTVIRSRRSRPSMTSSTVPSGVAGLSPTPTCLPRWRACWIARWRFGGVPLVEEADVAARLDEVRGVALRALDHQMDLERKLRPPAHRLHDRDPHREVGDEQPVHDVDVEAVRPAPLGIGDLLAEAQVV